MANVYFDLSLTGSGGAGTTANPYTGTQARAQITALANGDTGYICGRLEGVFNGAAPITIASKTGVTLRQWSGQKQASFSGAIGVPSGWSGPVSSVYTATLATSLSIEAVTFRYYDPANLNANYSRCAYLQKMSSAAAVAGQDKSWFYDSATGVLSVRCSGLSAAPTTYTAALAIPAAYADTTATVTATAVTLAEIEYVKLNASNGPMFFDACTGLTIQGIMQDRMGIRSSTGPGYGFQFNGCASTLVKNCWCTDNGYHSIGFIGSPDTGNVIDDCLVGDGGAYAGHTSTVNYCNSSTAITGAVVQNSYVRSSHLRLYGGTNTILPADPGAGGYSGYSACYAHTNATPTLTDITVRNCDIVLGDHYANVEGTTAGNQQPQRGDINDPADYVFQAINNRYRYENISGRTVTTRPQLAINTNTGSYRNCRFNFDNSGYTTGANINTTGNNGTIFYPSSVINARTLFAGCTFISDQGPNSGANPSVFVCTRTAGVNCELVFDSCTFVLNGSWSSGDVLFVCSADADNTASLRFKNCMFINAGTQTGSGTCYLYATYSAQNTTQTLQRVNRTRFEGCAYIGLSSTTGYMRIANFGSGTAAAWTAVTAGAWDGTVTPPIGGMDPGAFTRAYTAAEWDTTTWKPKNATILAAINSARTARGNANSNAYASRGIGAAPYGGQPTGFPVRSPITARG